MLDCPIILYIYLVILSKCVAAFGATLMDPIGLQVRGRMAGALQGYRINRVSCFFFPSLEQSPQRGNIITHNKNSG